MVEPDLETLAAEAAYIFSLRSVVERAPLMARALEIFELINAAVGVERCNIMMRNAYDVHRMMGIDTPAQQEWEPIRIKAPSGKKPALVILDDPTGLPI